MKSISGKTDGRTIRKGKMLSMGILFALSAAIAISGFFFTVYSLCYNISFKVVNTDVPGSIFGLCVLYLGIRYFMQAQKLKREVYRPSSKFSWNNFRKRNTVKSR